MTQRGGGTRARVELLWSRKQVYWCGLREPTTTRRTGGDVLARRWVELFYVYGFVSPRARADAMAHGLSGKVIINRVVSTGCEW